MQEALTTRLESPEPVQPSRDGFWRAVLRLRENPLVQREWRGLCLQMRDWRLWAGLRVPRDARGWGVPAIAWFILGPYILWATLSPIRRLSPADFSEVARSIDTFSIVVGMLALYLLLVSAQLCGMGFLRERRAATWDLLRLSPLSNDDLLLGLVVGRLAPVLASGSLVGLGYALLRPHYANLLQDLAPVPYASSQMLLATAWLVLLAGLAGVWSLALSVLVPRLDLAVGLNVLVFAAWAGAIGYAFFLAGETGFLIVTLALVGLTPLTYLAARGGLARQRVET